MAKAFPSMTAICCLLVALQTAQAAAADNETTIGIDDFTFAPAQARVKAGTKVVFVNHDDTPHNVVAEAAGFRSKALDTNESVSFVFDRPGELAYFCGLHPQMKGKITVTP